jgi:hypothetical protein
MKKKKKKKRAEAVAANEEKNAYVKPELDAQGPHPLTQKLSDSRDDSVQVSELPVRDHSAQVSELPGRDLVRELEG